MIKKVIKEEVHCDLCNRRMPSTSRDKYNLTCICCKKDVCFNCRILLMRRKRIREYKYTQESIGSICIECAKKKKIIK